MATEKSILVTKSSENRRSNKPIMEKRRRARINSCLNDLKTLILEAMKKDPARHSKLEKADILEMTVKHLQNLQRHQMAMSVASDPTVLSKYRAGFNECASEVSRYMSRSEGLDPTIRNRLLNHLANCLAALCPPTNPSFSATGTTAQGNTTASPVQIQVAGRPAAALSVVPPPLSCDVVGGIQLVPSRLSNGDIAFLLPGGQLASHVIPVYSPNSSSPSATASTVVTSTDTHTTSSQTVPVQTRVNPACDRPLSVSVASPSRGPLSPSSTVSSNVSTLSPIGSDFSDSSITPNTTPNLRPTTPSLEPENLSARESETDRMWRPW